MHITFFDDKIDPVTEHDWVVDAIKFLGKKNEIDLVCTRESGISSVARKLFDHINVHHFDRERFYSQNSEELARISSFTGNKKSIVWLTSHYEKGTTPMEIWSHIASEKDKNITLAIKTATVRSEFTRENYYPEDGKFVGGVIAVSKATKNELVELFHIPPDWIYIAYMGIGLDVFDFNKYGTVEEIRRKWNFDPEDIIIGSVGSLVSRKGHELILEAFTGISEKFPEVKLAIAGRGELEEELKQKCRESNLSDRVTFLGYHTQIAPFMKMFDILVLASDREGGIPRVITEAMAMKTVVISVNLGGIHELIQDGFNGFLLDSRTSGSIKEKLEILLSSPDMLMKLKNSAFISIKELDRTLWLEKLEESFSEIWSRNMS